MSTVHATANLILANCNSTVTPPTVNINWVTQFLHCTSTLKTQFSQSYDYKWALCEDPKVIQEWFRLVQNTIQKYGIVQKDIYNFDETGFQIGIIETAKVVTGSERDLHSHLVQSENTE